MPSRKRSSSKHGDDAPREGAGASVRPLWSGTITFGLVSIPVDLLSAIRPRQTSMKLVDKDGHALGRQYHCSKEDKKLSQDDLVRGYETESGKIIEITDAEFESVAPEMSGDIELRSFVPLEQIPPIYFQKPYYLAPAGKSAKAYVLLAATMERTGRVGIGSFVMRGHEYLVAIVSDNGVLRADTLRYYDEIRQPDALELPKVSKGAAKKAVQFAKAIDELIRDQLDVSELVDQEAAALHELVQSKRKDEDNVIHRANLEDADVEESGGAKIIDLMAVLRKSLSKDAVVRPVSGGSGEPISLDERRARRQAQAKQPEPKKTASKKRKSTSARKSSKRKRRA